VSSRRSHLILIALLLLALVGVVVIGVPGSPAHKHIRKGLDLQGGLEVVLKAVPPRGHTLTQEDLDRSVDIMRSRVDKLGVSEPEIRKQNPDQIVIELAGVHNLNEAADIIGTTAQLELYDLETSLYPNISIGAQGVPIPTTSIFDLLTRVQKVKGQPEQYYVVQTVKKTTGTGKKKKTTTVHKVVNGPSATLHRDPKTGVAGVLDKYGGKVPNGKQLLKVPHDTVVITCTGKTSVVCPGLPTEPAKNKTYYYLFKHTDPTAEKPVPQMTGKELKLKGTRQDFDPSSGSPIVTMQFTKKGNKIFHDVTRTEAVRGSIKGFDQHFAIVLDNEIRSFPTIDHNKYPDGIDPTNGGAEITGMASLGEAKKLALVLQTGALPVEFQTIERTDVSATLGKDSLTQARNAAIGGLIVVALFLLVLYRFLGLVAVIGLGIYAAFMYAAILLFGVTLTLPGFAGLILTIGVAADANVVVFERIKEEARAGKSVRAAIAAGYAKGFHTIIDANVVTMITALVLFAVATAGVKGFALMLLIGTVVSLITAVAATRAMLGLLAGFRWFENPRFMGASGTQKGRWLQIDFMRRRYLWFAISGVVIVIGAVSLGVRGLNLGIDFRGGVQVTFKTPQPTSISDVRAQAADIGRSDAVVQGRGTQTGSDKYENFQIRLKKLDRQQQARLTNDLQERVHAQSLGVKNVSSSFGRQIARSAILAIVFSLFLIVLYCTIRFDLKYAVPVIVAMIHDVIITVGIYSLLGREVTASTVAAVLTVLGYSIYDTIIIFDRIRENVPIMRRASFATIANVSLWETIRRSLATTFITLLPVVSLLFFGGATLKDFAFALLIGITSGAYSSIFVAAPLVTLWKEREPDYARRRGDVLEGAAGDRVLRQAEVAAAQEPTPETPVDVVEDAARSAFGDGDGDRVARDKRERRRQRRQARPHGRPR
jgi:SecD/SecF fusion protein